MDLTQIKEKYGSQCVNELLDVLLIRGVEYSNEDWRMFCVRHGIVTKHTLTVKQVTKEYIPWNNTYKIVLKNGRGLWVLNAQITTDEIENYRKGE